MELKLEDIRTLTETVWESMLGLPLTPDTNCSRRSQSRSTVVSIQITGAWNGAVIVDCPAEIARKAAAAMFSTKPQLVGVSDMQDAVAEITNMIGGNFKSLLPETCYLSLPSAVEGGDYSARIPGSKVVFRLDMMSDGSPVTITVVERIARQETSVAA